MFLLATAQVCSDQLPAVVKMDSTEAIKSLK